jgi:hypothetical protein
VVLFGKDQQFRMPLMLEAGKSIMVNGLAGDRITISRFAANAEPEQREVSARVDEVIRAIVELGGTYPDVVQALQQAKADGALASRFEVDALPQPGRRYLRTAVQQAGHSEESESANAADGAPLEIATPLPDLFGRPR